MSTTDHIDTPTLVRDLRPAGIAGWAATVLLFSGVITMSSGGAPEPNFDAPAAEIQRYATDLRSITGGQGTFSWSFSHYQDMPHDHAKKVLEAAQKEKEEAKS